jgi:predicted XRE-type DNA-binding protein
MSNEPASTASSGNPYADFGMADAETRLAKARLAQQITAVMREQNLTQVALAEKLGIDQPRVSLIVRGQLNAFSLDRLMALVNRLNLDIEIRVTPNTESARPAHTVVRYQEDGEGLAAFPEMRQVEGFQFD